MHIKIPKICTGYRVSEANIYLYHSTEIAKARPHSEEWQTDTSVQKQWSMGETRSFLLLNLQLCEKFSFLLGKSVGRKMALNMEKFHKIFFSRLLLTIIFRPKMVKFHPYSILTG